MSEFQARAADPMSQGPHGPRAAPRRALPRWRGVAGASCDHILRRRRKIPLTRRRHIDAAKPSRAPASGRVGSNSCRKFAGAYSFALMPSHACLRGALKSLPFHFFGFTGEGTAPPIFLSLTFTVFTADASLRLVFDI